MKSKNNIKFSITSGIELETYSIITPENRICRELHFPIKSTIEKGERFVHDTSIGTEYNSKVFYTIREALFLLKNGLRKYTQFRRYKDSPEHYVIFPIGGWIDRFAGCHIHLGVGKNGISAKDAFSLYQYLHDHIPFLIALTANSPVWRRTISNKASNRLLKGTGSYCKITRRKIFSRERFSELTYNPKHKQKPATVEMRVCDSSIPEYVVAALCVCKAVALRWLQGENSLNISTHKNYRQARHQAVTHGVRARLVWSNHWISVPEYVDLFFKKYKNELDQMDIPEEIITIFKYLKKGWNQAEIIRKAAQLCRLKNKSQWEREFAKRYISSIQDLLNGNSVEKFAAKIHIKLPKIKHVRIGGKIY